MPDRDRASELGLAAALKARNRGIGSLSMVVRIAVATTVSYLLAVRLSGSSMPIFAPVTTLLVVQTSPFSTLGMTAQRVLGTGVGVAVATVYVSLVPVTWWSVLLALLVSLLVARQLPVGVAGQLQIPLATVFVLALGPGDLSVDLWRVADVALGGVIGVLAVFVAPPRPQLEPARIELAALSAEIVGLLVAMAAETGTHAEPLGPDSRHAFLAPSRALRTRAQAVADAVDTAVESVRFNPRARRLGADLDLLDRRAVWLRRIAVQARGLSGAVDRVYDREGLTPALTPASLELLLRDLARLLATIDRDGVDDDAAVVDTRLVGELRAGVAQVTASYAPVDALASLSTLGRIDHLRALVTTGPLPEADIERSPEDDPEIDEAPASAAERVRRLLRLD